MATTSAPEEPFRAHGRPDQGAAAARTAELYAEYGRTVSGLCGALLRDRVEAEDAAQQTFLSAHRALLNGSEPLQPAAWLAAIARNECWSRIRTRMREPLPVETAETASAEPDPLAEAIRRADLGALWHAIDALPRKQRDALLLREFGGLSYDELAVALAVSAPAIESLLFRARRRLRAALRAAYASASGAPWLDGLVRVLAGGGAPVAAKVAVLGVGAAALTGGAAVAPTLLDRPHLHVPHAPAKAHSRNLVPRTPAVRLDAFRPAASVPAAAPAVKPAPHVRRSHQDDGAARPEPTREEASVSSSREQESSGPSAGPSDPVETTGEGSSGDSGGVESHGGGSGASELAPAPEGDGGGGGGGSDGSG